MQARARFPLVKEKNGTMEFNTNVTWRASQRGLVVCAPGGETLLVEHTRAAALPDLIDEARSIDELAAALGASEKDRRLALDLVAEHILVDPDAPAREPSTEPARRVVFSRSGVEFTGIAPVARAVHRVVMPILLSWAGRIAIGLLIVAGAVALIAGRPAGPQVTEHPWMDATLGLALGLAMATLHELAHAVALVHYGRTPRRAGCGFYWGALCFYVDSTDGMTLPRRARIINAMAGLAVDLVTTAVLLLIAQGFAATVLITGVCWRIAILQLIGIVENTLPILEVDGHVAFSDYLDEPDLSPRSKDALARKLRRIKHDDKPSWLAAYGAFSIVGGIVLLATSTWVWWLAAGELIASLFAGNPAEILLGLYVVLPVGIAVVLSTVGLLLEVLAKPEVFQEDSTSVS